MKLTIYGIALVALSMWVIKEHKGSKNHMEGKKSLNLSDREWIKVLEKSIEESWGTGLFYGCLLGIVILLFLQALKNYIF